MIIQTKQYPSKQTINISCCIHTMSRYYQYYVLLIYCAYTEYLQQGYMMVEYVDMLCSYRYQQHFLTATSLNLFLLYFKVSLLIGYSVVYLPLYTLKYVWVSSWLLISRTCLIGWKFEQMCHFTPNYYFPKSQGNLSCPKFPNILFSISCLVDGWSFSC